MEKNKVTASILGVFSLAGFYIGGVKMGIIFLLGMWAINLALITINENLVILSCIIGGAAGYFLAQKHNEELAKAQPKELEQ